MTKEEFISQMLQEVITHKQNLEQAELHRVQLSEDILGADNLTFNPFLQFDPKYFNIKLLSNLQGLNSVMYRNPDVNVHQIKMFIVCNKEFKVLNQVLNHSPYMVEQLKAKTKTPMDIAISYARWEQLNDRYKHLPKR